MKKSFNILLIASAMLSVGVMSAAHKSDVTLVVVDDTHAFDLSKIEPFTPSTFVIKNYDCGDLVTYDLSVDREYTIIKYVVGKVQNKALPLSKKLYLHNCQLAFK